MDKGNVPITILVLGVFVVCTFALVSFVSVNSGVSQNYDDIYVIQKVNQISEKLNFEKSNSVNIESSEYFNKEFLISDFVFSVKIDEQGRYLVEGKRYEERFFGLLGKKEVFIFRKYLI